MKLTAAERAILINRLADVYGGSVEAWREYSEYVDGVIIDMEAFETINAALDFLTKNYGRLVIS